MKDKKTICIFCSSNKNLDQSIIDEAKHFGEQLAKAGFNIVWGGCDMASMGAVARGAQKGGGKVIAVVTQYFLDNGDAFTDADELIVAKDLRERKSIMQNRANAFAILPGGFGTLDEFFDILASQIIDQRLGHDIRPIVILNSKGFYDKLEKFFDDLYTNNAAEERYKKLYKFVDTFQEGSGFLKENLLLE